MRKFGRFVKDVGNEGLTSLLAAFVCFGLTTWEHFHDKPVAGYVFLCISVVLFYIGAYLAWSKKDAELETLIANRAAPEVVVTCDWPALASHPTTLRRLLGRRLILKTLSDVAALDVEVQAIPLGEWTAHFKMLPLLEQSAPKEVECYIERTEGPLATTSVWDFEALVRAAVVASGLELQPFHVPVIVHYKDSHNGRWEGINELSYDAFLEKGEVHFIRRRSLG
jgi:hypothetical protein